MKGRYSSIILFLALTAVGLMGCQEVKKDSHKKTPEVILTVQPKASVSHLYYSGVISPIKTISVFSPVEGRVRKLFFKYGQIVHERQKLFSINSEKLETDFRQAITQYLQDKNQYNQAYQTYVGSEALYKAGVISQETFGGDKTSYETSMLSYYQSKYQLEKILNQASISFQNVENMTFQEVAQLNDRFRDHFTNVEVFSNATGVALFPIDTSNSDSNNSGNSDSSSGDAQLSVGNNVRQNQLLLSIGDLRGITASIQVSEVDVNRIKPGQKVVVTGVAFPGLLLSGSVISVASQAEANQNGGSNLSMFNVDISVPEMPSAANQLVHVGMTAKLDVEIQSPPHIMVPIQAVTQQNGQSTVRVLENGKKVSTSVTTGATTETEVVILSGLKPGDQVVMDE